MIEKLLQDQLLYHIVQISAFNCFHFDRFCSTVQHSPRILNVHNFYKNDQTTFDLRRK